MFDTLRRVTILMVAAALAAPVVAHGGQFRAPPTPNTNGPRSGSDAPVGGPTSWITWWEYNKDPFLQLRTAVHDPGAVDASSQNTRPTSLAPTDAMRRDLVLPALKRAADEASNADIQTAALVAMGKIGEDHRDFELLPALRLRLRRGNQEIRETAALSLGLTRRIDAIDDLVALAENAPAGRRLVRSEEVERRTRAFAIYGLGLIGERHSALTVQRQISSVLAGFLDDDDRDLRVAAIQAMSILNLHEPTSGHKRLLWKCIADLWAFYERDLGSGDELIQAHVPTAVARMLGRGNSGEHAHAKRILEKELARRQLRGPAIRQSAVMALGKLVMPPEAEPADRDYSNLLTEHASKGTDELARYLALMALAEIGGASNRATLLRVLQRGGKATAKPWAALALGVLTFREREFGAPVDSTVGRALLKQFTSIKNDRFLGAASVALGLCGFTDAIPDMRKVLAKHRRREILRGYIAIGFALMEAKSTIPDLRELVDDAEHMPLLMRQAAIALGRLGDKEAVEQLSKVLKRSNANVARLSGIATSFRYIGDRRVVDRLVDLLEDRELTKLARAFVAAALGGVCDRNPLPWNSSYSVGTNYRAGVETLSNGATGILDIL